MQRITCRVLVVVLTIMLTITMTPVYGLTDDIVPDTNEAGTITDEQQDAIVDEPSDINQESVIDESPVIMESDVDTEQEAPDTSNDNEIIPEPEAVEDNSGLEGSNDPVKDSPNETDDVSVVAAESEIIDIKNNSCIYCYVEDPPYDEDYYGDDYPEWPYNYGNPIKPKVTLKRVARTWEGESFTPYYLKQGTDYTVTYTNNIHSGTAKITIKGIGSYTGTITEEFYIRELNIKPKVTISTAKYYYDGTYKKPKVKVTCDGRTFVEGKDYTVNRYSAKNVGKHTLEVEFSDDFRVNGYYGSCSDYNEYMIEKTFKIMPPNTSITSISSGVQALTIKWNKKTEQISGYQIQYSTSSSFKNSKKIKVSKKINSKRLVSLKAGKKYYVRIRTYKKVDGSVYYSKWSNKKSVTVRKASTGDSLYYLGYWKSIKVTDHGVDRTGSVKDKLFLDAWYDNGAASKPKLSKDANYLRNGDSLLTADELTWKVRSKGKIRLYYVSNPSDYITFKKSGKYLVFNDDGVKIVYKRVKRYTPSVNFEY